MGSSLRCTESWRRQVAAYHDGAVPEHQRQMVTEHLRTCESCRNLMASYEQIYHKLRTLPGFEGMLTIDRPASRRRARPVITWNRRELRASDHQQHMGWNGGIAAFLLLVIITIAIITSKGATLVGPSSAPTLITAAAPTFAPTFGPQTANGLTCANAGNNAAQPYAYLDADSVIWEVSGCSKPTKLAAMHSGNARLGSWSPDGKWLTVFGLPATGGNATTLYVVNAATGVVKQLPSTGSGNPTTASTDQALWLDNATLIIRAGTTLSKVTVVTDTSTAMNINDATRFALFNGMLFYSTTAAKLMWRNLAIGADVPILTLTRPDDAWAVSADGGYVAFVHTDGATTTVAYQQLEGATANTVFMLPAAMTVQDMQFSPDSSHIATLLTHSKQQNPEIAVASFTDSTPALYPTSGTFAWRADSLAVIAQPVAPGTATPQLIAITTGAQTALPEKTADYVWQPMP